MHNPRIGWGFTFSGNFVRSTGLGEITDELPRFGPFDNSYGHANRTLRCPADRTFAADLQRTYYYEQIVRGNDFSAIC